MKRLKDQIKQTTQWYNRKNTTALYDRASSMEHRIEYFWVNGNPNGHNETVQEGSRLILLADTITVFATLLFETQPTLTCRAVSFPN